MATACDPNRWRSFRVARPAGPAQPLGRDADFSLCGFRGRSTLRVACHTRGGAGDESEGRLEFLAEKTALSVIFGTLARIIV